MINTWKGVNSLLSVKWGKAELTLNDFFHEQMKIMLRKKGSEVDYGIS